MISRYIRVLVALGILAVLVGSVYMFYSWWEGRNKSKVLEEGGERRYSPQLVEVFPQKVDKIDQQDLVNQEAAEKIDELRQEINWYAQYTAELEQRVAEGAAQVQAQDNGYKVAWSESWSDGETWTDGTDASYHINYHLPPIDLQVYRSDGSTWVGTTTSGVAIGKVQVVEKAKPWWKKLGVGVYAGAASYNSKLKPLVGLGLSYSGWGVELELGGGFRGVMVGKEW
jgi:hypothetical protein